MHHGAVFFQHLLSGDERYGGVVLVEVVGHFLDLTLDARKISAFLRDDIAVAGMLLTCGEYRILPAAHSFQRGVHRDRVLTRVQNALDAADGVRVSLADAGSPESVAFAFGKACLRKDARKREHAGIPSCGNDRGMTGGLCGIVNVRDVLGDPRVRVETVHDIEMLDDPGRHDGKVRRAAAADDDDIKLPLIFCDALHGEDGNVRRHDGNGSGITPREHGAKLHVRVLPDGGLDASAEIAVACDCDLHRIRPFFF